MIGCFIFYFTKLLMYFVISSWKIGVDGHGDGSGGGSYGGGCGSSRFNKHVNIY